MEESNIYNEIYKRIKLWLGLCLGLYLVIEGIGTFDLIARIRYLSEHMDICLINYILILTITSPCLAFTRMLFVFNLFSIGLIGFSCVSYTMRMIRGLPLRMADLEVMDAGMSLADKYLSGDLIFLVILMIAIAGIILIKTFPICFKIQAQRIVSSFIVVVICVNGVAVAQVRKVDDYTEVSSDAVTNVETSEVVKLDYSDDGMIYGFMTSCEQNNKYIPVDYSKEKIDEIKKQIEVTAQSNKQTTQPNYIFLQVESFVDPYSFKEMQYSQDPISQMRPYLESKDSGILLMPDMNTARTEFEILTGVRLANLFKYSIPYVSKFLDDRPIESIAQILRNEGYHTTALHNNDAMFYKRTSNYNKLGFDHFISLNEMENVDYFNDWPKDEVFLPYVKATIENTNEPDFLFVVTVGTHSSYSYDYENINSVVKVNGPKEAMTNQVQDYVDRLYEADQFVGQMIHYVKEEVDEPTVLVVYGDHIPTLDVISFDTSYKKYEVPYFVVSNMDIAPSCYAKEVPLPAYELYTDILRRTNKEGGYISSVQNAYKSDANYYHILDLVAYDLLFGNTYLYEIESPYEVTNLQMGTPPKN